MRERMVNSGKGFGTDSAGSTPEYLAQVGDHVGRFVIIELLRRHRTGAVLDHAYQDIVSEGGDGGSEVGGRHTVDLHASGAIRAVAGRAEDVILLGPRDGIGLVSTGEEEEEHRVHAASEDVLALPRRRKARTKKTAVTSAQNTRIAAAAGSAPWR